MPAKAVNFMFDGLLKAFHDEKRGHDSGEPDGDAGDGDLMDRGRKSPLPAAVTLPLPESF